LAKRAKLIFNAITAIFLIFPLASCSLFEKETATADYIFKVCLESNPYTLDPQNASEKTALKVISNLYDGLLKTDADGNIVSDAAAEYGVSDGGLTYTFTLRRDILWKARGGFEANLTADDFVFAFRRLFSPSVKSPNAERYYCVKNAEAARKGEVPPESIGVKADGDYSLTITLEYPEPSFPLLLTFAPAYPCNEEFYIQSSGRYGLTADAVCSNGAFYLSEWFYDPWWTEENRIEIRRNSKNAPDSPLGVNFLMDRGKADELFGKGETDCAVLSAAVSGLPYTESENSVCGVVFGENADPDFRKALAAATDIMSEEIPDIPGYRKTKPLIPDSVMFGGEFYRDKAGVIAIPREPARIPAAAQNLKTLIIPDDPAVAEYVGFITQQWQEAAFFCRVETENYEKRLASGDYDLAVKKITAAYNSPEAILEQFGRSGENLLEFKQAETEILENAEFIPICFPTEYFCYGKNVSGLVYDSFSGTVNFREGKWSKK